MIRQLRGVASLELTGAAPEACLSRWVSKDLAFWRLRRCSEFVYTCRVWAARLPELEKEASRAQCNLRLLGETGFPVLLRRLRRRPVLLYGLPFVLLLALFLQNFVWFVQVEGNRETSAERVLCALWEEGLRFGAWGPGLDPVMINSRILNRVPELKWITVNRSGGLVTVSCSEREKTEKSLDKWGVADLAAVRDGLVRELHVINGFPRVEEGDLVKAGDILISGTMEWTTHIQATHAMGEVYASTLRTAVLVCPDESLEKCYTGRKEICRTLIFQRKRRKISGNSSIFGTMCDRITEINEWSLPGGYTLPVRVETVTLYEYRLEPAVISLTEAESLLNAEALRQTEAQMIAGRVEQGSAVTQKKENGYICRAALNCLELISRTVPAEPYREEELNGETD